LEDLPYVIKIADKEFVVHAGINPNVSVLRQNKETLIYARTYNPLTNSVVEPNQPAWYSYPPKEDCIIHYGHQVSSEYHVSTWAKALDGGAVFGGTLRAFVWPDRDVIEVQSKTNVNAEDAGYGVHENLLPYENLVMEKFISKSEKDDLVLYKYTDKCTFERRWNDITKTARGIIFNKTTGQVVARPFTKFFNLNEVEETQEKNLPGAPYEIYDKLDGSLGVIYFYKEEWCVATAGSFYSEQAIYAKELLKKYNMMFMHSAWTLLVEIVYPENKIVCNYNGKRDLIILAAIETATGKEASYCVLQELAKSLDMPLVYQHEINLAMAIETKKTLPKDIEGYVIRFHNGLRLKIKGDEYLRLHRIISNLTPLNVWSNMKNGKLTADFKKEIPEELLPDVEAIESKLFKGHITVRDEIIAEIRDNLGPNFDFWLWETLPFEITPEIRKKVGLLLQEKKKIKHKGAFFPYVLGDIEGRDKYIMKVIRPVSNVIEEQG